MRPPQSCRRTRGWPFVLFEIGDSRYRALEIEQLAPVAAANRLYKLGEFGGRRARRGSSPVASVIFSSTISTLNRDSSSFLSLRIDDPVLESVGVVLFLREFHHVDGP